MFTEVIVDTQYRFTLTEGELVELVRALGQSNLAFDLYKELRTALPVHQRP